MLTLLIGLLAGLSYSFGISSICRGKYQPSIYSRVVWLLIAVNCFIGVLALNNSPGTLILTGISVIGSLVMLISALKYSVHIFGVTEIICTILLAISIVLWITLNAPLVNVMLGLVAHFIGGIPSIVKAIKKSDSENMLFWLFFALASALAFIQADKTQFDKFIFSFYHMVFDGGMTLLAARQYFGYIRTLTVKSLIKVDEKNDNINL
jgi:hypothetical protein